MTIVAKRTAKLVDHLPKEKANAVLEFAYYMAEKSSEEAWEHHLSSPHYAKRFKARIKEVNRLIARGKSLDFYLHKL